MPNKYIQRAGEDILRICRENSIELSSDFSTNKKKLKESGMLDSILRDNLYDPTRRVNEIIGYVTRELKKAEKAEKDYRYAPYGSTSGSSKDKYGRLKQDKIKEKYKRKVGKSKKTR